MIEPIEEELSCLLAAKFFGSEGRTKDMELIRKRWKMGLGANKESNLHVYRMVEHYYNRFNYTQLLMKFDNEKFSQL